MNEKINTEVSNTKVSMDISSSDIVVEDNGSIVVPSDEIYSDNLNMNTMLMDEYDPQIFEEESKEISSVTILIIVVVVCTILGIAFGIVLGKKSANK